VTNKTKFLKAETMRCSWLRGTAAAFVAVVSVASGFATSAIAQSVPERLRGCLTIEDMTKARLDCYDAIVPPVIEDCRLVKQDDQRLNCFNRFLELSAKPATLEVAPVASKPEALSKPGALKAQPSAKKSKGCSLPGLHRLPDGTCTSRRDNKDRAALNWPVDRQQKNNPGEIGSVRLGFTSPRRRNSGETASGVRLVR
jgi:hypothetical protein